MGGPITKVLASDVEIDSSLSPHPQVYYLKGEAGRKLNVYFRGVSDSGTPAVSVEVKPIVASYNGSAYTGWPFFSDLNADGTADSTLPVVVPNQGIVSVTTSVSGVAGMVIVTPAASAGNYVVRVTAATTTNVTYTLTAEFV